MQNLQITRGLLQRRLSCHCIHVATFKHVQRLIQSAMPQIGVSTLSSFEAHADIMFAAATRSKNIERMEMERQRNEMANYCRLMALYLLSPALTRIHNALLCPVNYSRRPILANLDQSCWSAPLSSSICTMTRFYHRLITCFSFTFVQIKKILVLMAIAAITRA